MSYTIILPLQMKLDHYEILKNLNQIDSKKRIDIGFGSCW